KGNISKDSILLHVDNHLDDVPDGINVPGVLTAQSKDEIMSLIRTNEELNSGKPLKTKIQIDNFIWPAVARKTVGTVFTVSPDNQDDFASWVIEDNSSHKRYDSNSESQKYLNYIPLETFQQCVRAHTLDEFNERFLTNFNNIIFTEKTTKILDLDLDFFTKDSSLLDELWIRKTIHYLLNLCKWDLITVALSPFYCGGNQNALKLLDMYLDEAGLDLGEATEW
ncbi:UPF0489 family protein, partial [Streptomyces sp. NPDC057131]|uniref:UPF0489 family protein n=1 Tax=Streptomyces sp. NPDC057131 TaxID=3346027 RepID=UPI00362927D8